MPVTAENSNQNRPILFFDGVCNLCNTTIQFILRHERSDALLFSPLQSDLGQRTLQSLASGVDSLVLFENEKLYIESTAAVHVAAYLRFPYSLLRHLKVIPRFIRDPLYRGVARYRYKLFGKRLSCMVPSAPLKDRFV